MSLHQLQVDMEIYIENTSIKEDLPTEDHIQQLKEISQQVFFYRLYCLYIQLAKVSKLYSKLNTLKVHYENDLTENYNRRKVYPLYYIYTIS